MKIAKIFLFSLIVGFFLTACGSKEDVVVDNTQEEIGNKYNIVVTNYPIYDWVNNIVGEGLFYDVSLLEGTGVDIHNYKPTEEDIEKIISSDLFIYIGGESDDWFEEINSQYNINSLKLRPIIEDYLVDEFNFEDLFNEGTDLSELESEGLINIPNINRKEIDDEHIWLSLRNARVLCEEVKNKIISLAPENKVFIENNFVLYDNSLIDLERKYSDILEKYRGKSLYFVDRFPFIYLFNDYGLDYFVISDICSSDVVINEEGIEDLINEITDWNIDCLIAIENTNIEVVNTIKNTLEEKDIDIITVNAIHFVSAKEVNQGTSYIKIMRDNLDIFADVLKS